MGIRTDNDYSAPQSQMALLPNYYRWIYSHFQPFVGKRISDLGCGAGHMLRYIAQNDAKEFLLGIDSSNANITNATSLNQDTPILFMVRDLEHYDYSDVLNLNVDTIFSLDVLEHIQDDVAVIKDFYRVLPRRGRVCIKVPAMPRLYGPMDEASGHYRRYSKTMVKNLARSAGFSVLFIAYMNRIALPVYYLKNKLLMSNDNFSKTFSEPSLRRLNSMMLILQRLDKLSLLPAGLSFCAVLEK